MAAEIGALIVRIGGDAEDLLKELNRSNAGLSSFNKAVKTAHDAAKAFAAGASAAGSAVAALVLQSSHAQDQMGKLAQAAGLATSTFSEYAYVARLSDVTTEAFSASISKLNRNVAEAATNTGESLKAFKALGIEVTNADGSLKGADEIMDAVSDRFAEMNDGAGKSAIAIALFGKAGAAMIPMLNEGSAKIKQLREEARALGVSIDTEAAKKAEQFNDNLTRLGQAAQGLSNRLTSELLPSLVNYTDQVVAAAKSSKDLDDSIRSIAGFIESAAVTVFQTFAVVGSDVAFTFRMIGGELGVIGAQLAAILRGDFKGAKLIGEEWTRDSQQARKDLDDFQARIMRLGQTKPVADGGAVDMGIGLDSVWNRKRAAPQMVDTKELEKREQEVRDAMHRVRIADDEREIAQVERTNKRLEEVRELGLKAEADIAEKMARRTMNPLADDESNQSINPERDARARALRDSLLSQEQIENQGFETRMAQLQDFSDQELAALGGKQALVEQMESDHQDNLSAIRRRGLTTLSAFSKASWGDQAKTMSGYLADMTAVAATSSRRMFEINKLAGIANVALSLPEKISDAYKWGTKFGGPVLGAAFASIAGAAGLAQLAAMRAASFGGGVAPSVGGSVAAPAVTPVAAPSQQDRSTQTTVVNLPGTDFVSTDVVRRLFDALNEHGRDGGRFIVRTAAG